MKFLSNTLEPARLRAAVTAVVQLCAALGIVLPFDLPGIAEAAIALGAFVLPLIQGEWTRAKVVPAAKLQGPGDPVEKPRTGLKWL